MRRHCLKLNQFPFKCVLILFCSPSPLSNVVCDSLVKAYLGVHCKGLANNGNDAFALRKSASCQKRLKFVKCFDTFDSDNLQLFVLCCQPLLYVHMFPTGYFFSVYIKKIWYQKTIHSQNFKRELYLLPLCSFHRFGFFSWPLLVRKTPETFVNNHRRNKILAHQKRHV